MIPDTLLTELDTRGITLRRSGDRLMVRDPGQALTPGLRLLIKKHKTALLSRLNVSNAGEQFTLATIVDPAAWPRLQVITWPSDLAHESLLWRLLNDSRCVKFYAADRVLCAALDSGNAAAIVAAQLRFDRALAEARALAAEIQGTLQRIGEGAPGERRETTL